MEYFYRYRITVTQKIDEWFFEYGNSRRTHKKAYDLFVRYLPSICYNSFLDHRHYPKTELAEYRLPQHVEIPLWIMVVLVKHSSVSEAVRILQYLRRSILRATRLAGGRPIDLVALKKALTASEEVEVR